MVLDVILMTLGVFWCPWADFFGFLTVLGVGMKFDDFLGIPWRGPG